MSQENTSPIQPAAHAAAPSATDPTTAGAALSSNKPADFDSKTTIASLDDLKKISPELYQQMMVGIAQTICNRMKQSQDRLKRIMREGQRDAEG